MEPLHVQTIDFNKDFNASKVRRARELATLSLLVRLRFSIAEQISTLSNVLVGILHLSRTKQAWQK